MKDLLFKGWVYTRFLDPWPVRLALAVAAGFVAALIWWLW